MRRSCRVSGHLFQYHEKRLAFRADHWGLTLGSSVLPADEEVPPCLFWNAPSSRRFSLYPRYHGGPSWLQNLASHHSPHLLFTFQQPILGKFATSGVRTGHEKKSFGQILASSRKLLEPCTLRELVLHTYSCNVMLCSITPVPQTLSKCFVDSLAAESKPRNCGQNCSDPLVECCLKCFHILLSFSAHPHPSHQSLSDPLDILCCTETLSQIKYITFSWTVTQ
jgi:hypothetical protein